MNFKNLKLATKQRVGFAIILVLLAMVNAYFLYKIRTIKDDIDEVTQSWMPRAIILSDINFSSSELRRIQLQQAFATDKAIDEFNIQSIELLDRIDNQIDTYDTLKAASQQRNLYSEEEGRLYTEFEQKWENYKDLSIEFFLYIKNDQNQEALTLLDGEAKDVFNDFSSNLVQLVNVNKEDSFAAAKRAEVTFKSTRRASLIILIVSVLLSIFIAHRLVRFITVPIHKLEEAAGKVAKGDLKVQLPVTSTDEVGSLAGSFNQMTHSLSEAKERMDRQAQKLRGQNKVLEKAMRELRETQDQLLMQEKMASLGDLVAGIAHELNNPVGTMNGSIDVSQRCLEKVKEKIESGKSIEDLKNDKGLSKVIQIFEQNIGVMLDAGNRIAVLVQGLKNFARLDESDFQKADIREGLESTLTLMSSEFQDRITIVKDLSEIPKIACFPGQLNQVFLNLLKNATDAIEGDGTIGVKTFRENSHVCIVISDTGRGIPQHKLKKIFDIGFTTGDSRIKMASGLSTAYNIVQKHNGEIKIESVVGKGSKFSILLPVN